MGTARPPLSSAAILALRNSWAQSKFRRFRRSLQRQKGGFRLPLGRTVDPRRRVYEIGSPGPQGLFAETGVSAGDVTHFVMPCVIRRVGARVAKTAGIQGEAICDNMHNEMGESVLPMHWLCWPKSLRRQSPVTSLSSPVLVQGCDAVMFKVGKISRCRPDGCIWVPRTAR
ncbi:MAG: hypothetical protein CM15mP75_0210 [Flammeovirgaceae bacterium]|nr:MAG: hypothetical protein CM15mP75_0210 [Flammeovirgaceae bacterium]